MTDTKTPFDDIRALTETMPEAEMGRHAAVLEACNRLGRGLRPVGKMDQDLAWLASWQGRDLPSLARPLIAVFLK